ncbi:DUF3883 domain-containing protein [Georgenia sp. Z1344]|uniref:DUF3883 domain-containing protein n=1 Tax=Georgenia sp. Z1344 TaxID=3416706 RepID=UPI003CEB7F6D
MTSHTETAEVTPDRETPAYLLTNNPKYQQLLDEEIDQYLSEISAGRRVVDRWSTGLSKKIRKGDRVYLLRQGVEPRGIIASGTAERDVYQDKDWRGGRKLINYVDVVWDTFLDQLHPLPTKELIRIAPHTSWRPQASGTSINAADIEAVDVTWQTHVAKVLSPGSGIRGAQDPRIRSGKESDHGKDGGAEKRNDDTTKRGTSQGRRVDPVKKKLTEDLAQQRLTEHFKNEGWTVEDVRTTKPYDALATKDGRKLYLEAKGTVTAGQSVDVTPNEVKFARNHPGQCVLGILSGVTFATDDSIDPGSGKLEIFDWNPDAGTLIPTGYSFTPHRVTHTAHPDLRP